MTLLDYTDTPFARRPRLHRKPSLEGPSSAGFARRNLVGMMGVMMDGGGTPAPSKSPYIETDGVASYIDFGFVPTVNTEYELCSCFSEIPTSDICGLISASGGIKSIRYRIKCNKTSGNKYDFSNPSWNGCSISALEKSIISFKSNIITCGNESSGEISSFVTASSTLKFGTTYVSDKPYYLSKVKMFYAKFWESGVLIRDLIPYSGPRGIGLFDFVNDVLYTNANTSGTLTYGEE